MWNFLKGSGPRRVKFKSKLENAHESALAKREEAPFPVDSDASILSRSASVTIYPASRPVLGKATVSLSRCVDEVVDSVKKVKGAGGKTKEN